MAVATATTIVEARNVSKRFDAVQALANVSFSIEPGVVTCLLGDNGAGKSTLIKLLAGVFPPDEGEIAVDGKQVALTSPRDALDLGIATVYQDLAMFSLMSITRNFFVGREPPKGRGPLRRVDWRLAARVAEEELARLGIRVASLDQAVGTLSGGQRQALAIARAVHFGARVLILDEPTSALGVRQAGEVLKYIGHARDRGLGVAMISHNVVHASLVGDRFVVLNRGRHLGGVLTKEEATKERLQDLMSGADELRDLITTVESDDTASAVNGLRE